MQDHVSQNVLSAFYKEESVEVDVELWSDSLVNKADVVVLVSCGSEEVFVEELFVLDVNCAAVFGSDDEELWMNMAAMLLLDHPDIILNFQFGDVYEEAETFGVTPLHLTSCQQGELTSDEGMLFLFILYCFSTFSTMSVDEDDEESGSAAFVLTICLMVLVVFVL